MELSRFMRSPQARDPIAGSGTRQIPTHWRDFARALQEQVAHAGRCRHRRRVQKHSVNLRGFANLLWKQLDHLRNARFDPELFRHLRWLGRLITGFLAQEEEEWCRAI